MVYPRVGFNDPFVCLYDAECRSICVFSRAHHAMVTSVMFSKPSLQIQLTPDELGFSPVFHSWLVQGNLSICEGLAFEPRKHCYLQGFVHLSTCKPIATDVATIMCFATV